MVERKWHYNIKLWKTSTDCFSRLSVVATINQERFAVMEVFPRFANNETVHAHYVAY